MADHCEECMHYTYDDEYECYICEMDLDQDEMALFLSGNTRACPYYRFYDEYKLVQKQN